MIKRRLHRFKKQITQIIFLVSGYWFLVTLCFAQSISSTELINNAKGYDGKMVVYEGEVIGDIMVRGEYAWINVNDGENAMGIWIDKDSLKDIVYTGSYKTKGDWVEIAGVFHRACAQHGGDLDIHSQQLLRIREGSRVIERISLQKRTVIIFLLGVLCLVWILRRSKHK